MANTYELIATGTATNATTSTFTFDSIPGTYDHLIVYLSIRSDQTDDNPGNYSPIGIRFNNSSSGYRATEVTHSVSSGKQSISRTTITIGSDSWGRYSQGIKNVQGSNTQFDHHQIYISLYANTSNYKTYQVQHGTVDDGSQGDAEQGFSAGVWENTNAITRIDFKAYAGYFSQYSSVHIFGIK